ncbi:hypothetical protein [Sorangium sp. So ce854]|uniref:hypothetical protein n=1 Tax=Sorangium sp. So ce854 TaxID=3133322 RepID=UPI003F64686C
MAVIGACTPRVDEPPPARLDPWQTRALAAWYAHLLSLSSGDVESAVKPLLAEAAPLRENLLGDAEALARRGLLDAATVADIRAGQGHIDMANDLVALSALFSASWPDIAGKTAATEEEVKRAGEVGPQLLAALGVMEHGKGPGPTEAADKRARAFALLVHAYDQIRRAVAFLRWDEGDADEIAPSQYKGRTGRATSSTETTAAPADETPAEPTASPGTPAPVTPAPVQRRLARRPRRLPVQRRLARRPRRLPVQRRLARRPRRLPALRPAARRPWVSSACQKSRQKNPAMMSRRRKQ